MKKQSQPQPSQQSPLDATVPLTRRPLSFFVGRTVAGLRSLGFSSMQLQEIRAAMQAAGHRLPESELLEDHEWGHGRSWCEIRYRDLLQMPDAQFESLVPRMPTETARELIDLRNLYRRARDDRD